MIRTKPTTNRISVANPNLNWHKDTATFSIDASKLGMHGIGPMYSDALKRSTELILFNPKTGKERKFVCDLSIDEIRDRDGELQYHIYRAQGGLMLKIWND